MGRPIKTFIIDDSAIVRNILSQGLGKDPEIEVIGSANDPFEAREKILNEKPDVLTLDVEMPRMDGVEFLRRLMPNFPIPTIVVSSLTTRGAKTTLDALAAGAIDVVSKPSAGINRGIDLFLTELRTKIKVASTASVLQRQKKQANHANLKQNNGNEKEIEKKVIAVGASTGGTEAIAELLAQLPTSIPGIVIVQHMPAKFTRLFADRLNNQCNLSIKEAEAGDFIRPGCVLIAPGEKHMRLQKIGGHYQVDCKVGTEVNGHCPSVDVLFNSVANHVRADAIGIILTGMGKDGAKGLLEMRNAGAKTFGQNEETSIVYGMPKVAFQMGAVENQLTIADIAKETVKIVHGGISEDHCIRSR